MDLDKKIELLQNWLAMLQFLPANSPEGIERDEFWRQRLQAELTVLVAKQPNVKCVNALVDFKNALITLKDAIKRH